MAWLVDFGGAVRIDRDGGKAEGGSVNAALYDGNWVSTGAGAKATVRYSDRTQLTVGENTRFKIGGKQGHLTLELESGSILSNSRQQGAGNVTVVTRYGRTQVLEGSEIQFNLGADGKNTMEVLFGSGEILSDDGKSVKVLEGEAMDWSVGAKRPAAGSGTAAAAAPDAGTAVVEAPEQSLPLQLVFATEKGKPFLKASGEKKFTPAPADDTPLSPGSEFKVPKGALAVLRGKGIAGRLSSGTDGAVGEALLKGEAEHYALTLENGAAEVDFTNRAARTVALKSRGRELLLDSRDLGGITVTVGKQGVELSVRAGELQITSGGKTVSASTGEQVVLTATGLKQLKKAPPMLVLPHSRKVRVYADRVGEVGLALPESADPNGVRVEVARDGDFNDKILSGVVKTGLVAVPAPANGELFWRALDAKDVELAHGRARFSPDNGSAMVDLEHPHAEVAETGLKASVLFQGEPPSLSFSFAPRDGAAAYRVRVYKQGSLTTPVAEKVVKETRATFEAGQVGEGQYLWNAAPLDGANAELAGGRMNKLELVYDNSRTTLAISRPKPGDVVAARGNASGKIDAAGIAPIGSKLFVNGRPATLDAKGRFEVDVPKADALVFRLVDGANEGYWIRQLRHLGRAQ